jgi:hypothetical protein
MSNLQGRKIFYIKSVSWIVPALFAIPIAIRSVVLNQHLFYLQYYLFTVSVICFFLSYRKYAILDDSSLTILFGIGAPGIIIPFDQIETIKCGTQKIDVIFSDRILKSIKKFEYILIILKSPLSKHYNLQDINDNESSIEYKKIEVAENGSSIILYQPPKGGFHSFLDKISKSVEVLNADIFEHKNKYSNPEQVLTYIAFLLCIIYLLYIIKSV